MIKAPFEGSGSALLDVVSTLRPRQLAHAAMVTSGDVPDGAVCIICQKSIAGLHGNGRCGHCGAAIGRSTAGNFLKFAAPAHVRELADGVAWMFWGVLGVLIAIGTGKVLAFGEMAGTALLAVALAGATALTVGAWRLTAPAHNTLDAAWQLPTRRRIRLLMAFGAGMPLMLLVTSDVGATGTAAIAMAILTILLGAAGIAGIALSLLLLGKLALRLPNLILARMARYAMFGVAASAAFALLAASITTLAAGSDSPWVDVGTAAYFGWIAVVGSGAFWMILLTQCRRAFTDQATLSEQTWAHHNAQPEE